ncbi:MAG: YihY/virulence factor BrkB family protein [Pleurocapsa sp. MO_226.B13]|nr:YihY/virulence factor BrkB family protein [Pleurocapsa sp. MO_226.B13]
MIFQRLIRFWRHLNLAVLMRVIQRIGKHRLFGLASEMAYSDLLALFPAILAILTALGNLNISRAEINFLAQRLRIIAPEEALNLIDGFASQVQLPQSQGLLSLSFIVALWVASSAINTAMTAMDLIYQTSPQHIRPFWEAKLVAIILTIAIVTLTFTASFLVFISDVICNLAVNNMTIMVSATLLTIWNSLRWPAALAIVSCGFGIIYRYGVSKWQPGTPIMPGAAIAALLWAVSSKLFRFYVANFANYSLTYGAAGAVVVLMLWLNLSSLALLIGAELNIAVGESIEAESRNRKDRHVQ